MVYSISYQEKVEKMAEWFPQVLDEIKRELKKEHLRKAPLFVQKCFPGKTIASITTEEMIKVYMQLLKQGDPQFLDLICYFWQVKHPELYPFFQKKLQTIQEDISLIEKIDDAFAQELVKESVQEFGAVNSYLFSLFYEVAFSEDVYASLRKLALEETENAKSALAEEEEARSCALLRSQHERAITRMQDKYEKKLAALEIKYHTDVGQLRQELLNLRQASQQPELAGLVQKR